MSYSTDAASRLCGCKVTKISWIIANRHKIFSQISEIRCILRYLLHKSYRFRRCYPHDRTDSVRPSLSPHFFRCQRRTTQRNTLSITRLSMPFGNRIGINIFHNDELKLNCKSLNINILSIYHDTQSSSIDTKITKIPEVKEERMYLKDVSLLACAYVIYSYLPLYLSC
jgi:hypothetical protein